MITIVSGVPGSGKTYYAVYQIYKEFIKKDTEKYNYLYTNINNFSFQMFSKFKEFTLFNLIEEKIQKLYSSFLEGKDDNFLNNLAKKMNFDKILLVVDESQIFFDKEKDSLVWYLTYHRHLYHDIILLTQNILLLHYKYRQLAETYIKARQRSLKFTKKTLDYSIYSDFSFKDKLSVFSLPALKNVFSLYQSGDIVKQKSFLQKYFVYILLLAFFSISVFVYLVHSFKSKASNNLDKNLSSSSVTHFVHTIPQKPLNVLLTPLFFKCYNHSCFLNNHIFPLSFLKNFAQNNKLSLQFYYSSPYSVLVLYVPKRFLSFFIKSNLKDNHEKIDNILHLSN